VGQIAVASADPRFTAKAVTVDASSVVATADQDKVRYHTVQFRNLLPDTEYAYRVGSPDAKNQVDGWSEWLHFRTASNKPEPFSFIYFGDAQNDLKSLWSRAIRGAYKKMPDAAFMIHAGDLVNQGDADKEWRDWFYAGAWVHGSIPCVGTPGNHEYVKSTTSANARMLSPLWDPQFNYPRNGVPGLGDTNYFIDYQGARIVSLNSNEKVEEQAVWLDKVLSTNPQKWTIVTFHHPVYSTAQGRDNKNIRDAWQPILQKHKVALVLQGHDHTYGRKNVPTGLKGVDPRGGTAYVVSVSGPKMYRLGEKVAQEMPRVAEFTQLFQVVRVSEPKIRFEAYTVTGELFDAFELTKNRDGSNRFRDLAPRTPNRKDPSPIKDED
jgi:hypothetical protein